MEPVTKNETYGIESNRFKTEIQEQILQTLVAPSSLHSLPFFLPLYSVRIYLSNLFILFVFFFAAIALGDFMKIN